MAWSEREVGAVSRRAVTGGSPETVATARPPPQMRQSERATNKCTETTQLWTFRTTARSASSKRQSAPPCAWCKPSPALSLPLVHNGSIFLFTTCTLRRFSPSRCQCAPAARVATTLRRDRRLGAELRTKKRIPEPYTRAHTPAELHRAPHGACHRLKRLSLHLSPRVRARTASERPPPPPLYACAATTSARPTVRNRAHSPILRLLSLPLQRNSFLPALTCGRPRLYVSVLNLCSPFRSTSCNFFILRRCTRVSACTVMQPPPFLRASLFSPSVFTNPVGSAPSPSSLTLSLS